MKSAKSWMQVLALLAMAVVWTPEALAATEIAWTYVHDGEYVTLGLSTMDGQAIPTSTSGAISIPSQLGGRPVRAIGDWAFAYCHSLTSVAIPDSVTSIGECAFYQCNGLTSMTIPNSVTNIGPSAFRRCTGLTSMRIPDNVKSLGGDAFCLCTNLTNLTIGKGTTFIGPSPCWGCSNLTTFSVSSDNPAYKSASGLLLTKDGKTLVSAVIVRGTFEVPGSVTRIGDHAFDGCNEVTSVEMTDSVTSIGAGAFSQCFNLKRVTIGNSVTNIGDSAFDGCNGLKSLAIPDNVTSIGVCAFYGCSGLASVTIGNSVKSIGNEAFTSCSSLRSLTIPGSVTNIGSRAFYNSGLEKLYVPASWQGTSMLKYAEVPSRCTVVYVTYQLDLGSSSRTFTADAASGQVLVVTADGAWTAQSSVPWLTVKTASGTGNGSIAYDVAANTGTETRTGIITVSGGGLTRTFTVTQSGKTLTLGASEKTFTADAANGMKLAVTANVSWTARSSSSWLTLTTTSGSGNGTITYNVAENTATTSRTGTITVSGGGLTRTFTVTQSGREAAVVTWHYKVVDGTVTVTGAEPSEGSLSIPSTLGGCPVTGIGYSAFSGCSALTSVTIPASVKSIDDHAFSGCSGLASVTIGNHVTRIGNSAFENCSALTSVAIPDSVTSIGANAFSGCGIRLDTNTLPGVYLVDGWAVGRSTSFSGALDLTGVRGIAAAVFYGCNGLTSVTIPGSVSIIDDYVFAGCSGLTSVTISEGVTGIWAWAFSGCSGLTSVTIPGSVEEISQWAFDGCSGLTAFRVATGNPSHKAIDGVLFSKDGQLLLRCPCGKTDSYAIPDSVTSIEEEAFSGCSGLTNVTIPNSVTYIRSAAFGGCSGLTSVTIPGNVTSIGDWVFDGCSGLTSVTISGAKYIGGAVFAGCSNLKTLYVPASWEGTSKLAEADVPAGCTVVYGMPMLELATSSRSFTADSAYWQQLAVTANVSWTANSSASWLPLVTSSGSGNGTITYCVDTNTATTSRTGYITVAGGGLSRTFTVVQSGAAAKLELGTTGQTFTADSADWQQLAVTANVAWTANSSASWLTVATTNGSGNGTITYNVAANTATNSRTGTITVAGGGLTRTFTVMQSGAAAKLELGATSQSFTADAASAQTLAVTANVSWTAKSSASWLAVATATGSGNGTIAYSVAANTATDSRTGTITVAGGDLTRTFTVTQGGAAAKLELGATSQSFTADAASAQTLAVTANVSWTAKSSASWLAVATASGSGNGTITYNVAANTGTASRTGTITVAGGGLTRTFTVTQGGVSANLELGTTSQSFTADAASEQKLAVSANISWTAQSSASWLVLTTASGSGNGNIVYAVTANTGTEERMGIITVTGGGLTRLFLVTQSGATADAVTWRYEVNDGTATVTGADPSEGALSIPSTLGGYPVTCIGEYAFYKCTNLTSVTIPDSVTHIEHEVFFRCSGLTNVTIPDSVTSIGGYTFGECSGLTTLTIPNSVTIIESCAFLDCSNLKELYIPKAWESKYEYREWQSGGGVFWSSFAGVPSGCTIIYYDPARTPVPVPFSWLDENASTILAYYTNDYESAAAAPAANGRPVWECYMADISPADATDFKATLSYENGQWLPKPVPDRSSTRIYEIQGTDRLTPDAVWGPTNSSTRFFRLRVRLP